MIVGAVLVAARHPVQADVAGRGTQRGADHLRPARPQRAAPTAPRSRSGFKIVTGKGTFVIPGVQTVRRLSLDLREAELAIDVRHPPGHPARRPRRRDLQGRRRLHLDRQRGAALPRPAAADGGARPQRLRRPPARDRRQPDGRGDDPRPREAHPADPRVLRHRDGEARADRRLPADPGDRGPDRLHHQPRPPARRGRRQPGPHRRRPQADREATEREQEAEALKAEARRDA